MSSIIIHVDNKMENEFYKCYYFIPIWSGVRFFGDFITNPKGLKKSFLR